MVASWSAIVIATVILPLANLSFLQIVCLFYLKFTKTEATLLASWSAIVIATVILPLANLSFFTNRLFILFKIYENGGDSGGILVCHCDRHGYFAFGQPFLFYKSSFYLI